MQIKTIDHVLITVPKGELKKAVHFYTNILKFPYISGVHPNHAEWFQMGDKQLHIRETEEIRDANSSNHIALTVSHLSEIKAYLVDLNFEITYSTKLQDRERIFFRDPWNNLFEFIEFL